MRGVSRPLARRYARALLEAAVEAEERGEDAPRLEELRGQLREALDLLQGHPELAAALRHPGLSHEAKKRVLAALWQRSQPPALLRRLLDLLVERDRIALLPAIEEAFREQVNERRGVVSAEAISAIPLAPEQARALAEALREAGGLEAELTTRVDESLIGGVLVRMGGKTYDGTLRSRLRALRRHLLQGR